MSRLHPLRGLAALVAAICVCGCEAARSANPVARFVPQCKALSSLADNVSEGIFQCRA